MEKEARFSNLQEIPISHTEAQLKGRRLRMVRALTGMSRQELYEKIGIATSTIDTWESGRVELNEKSSFRISDALKKVGIYCSSEWLLCGAGIPPRIMDVVEKSIFQNNSFDLVPHGKIEKIVNYKNNAINKSVSEDMRRELSFFISLHQHVMFYVLEKDFYKTHYCSKDCVAGIVATEINELIGFASIIESINGSVFLGNILSYSNFYSIIMIGEERKKIKIKKAAEIIWHRKYKKLKKYI